MKQLKLNVQKRITFLSKEITEILDNHSETTVGEVKVKHLLGGMRGLESMVCNTSFVDPYKGLFISGFEIPEFADKLPEEVFYLLCTGNFPNSEELQELQEELAFRAELPEYLWTLLKNLPKEIHPMTKFSVGILAMEGLSVFNTKHQTGIKKTEYWEYTLEDALNLLAKLPALAAGIYRLHHLEEDPLESRPGLDWGSNLAHLLGINSRKAFADLLKLYMVLHCDHEGGNVSAFTARVVNSALSNLFYATSAGLNGLAGPLHGLANQNCLRFIEQIHAQFGDSPSTNELQKYIHKTLDSGKLIPGYGHAVLRLTDPRFMALMEFGNNHCPNFKYFQTVKKLFYVVPEILKTHKDGKVANPWPNVDAISGTLLYSFGMKYSDFYTVIFGVSRTLGFCAQNIIARGLYQPIIRPKSVTNIWLNRFLNKNA